MTDPRRGSSARPRRPDGQPLSRAEMTPEQRRQDNLARRARKRAAEAMAIAQAERRAREAILQQRSARQ